MIEIFDQTASLANAKTNAFELVNHIAKEQAAQATAAPAERNRGDDRKRRAALRKTTVLTSRFLDQRRGENRMPFTVLRFLMVPGVSLAAHNDMVKMSAIDRPCRKK